MDVTVCPWCLRPQEDWNGAYPSGPSIRSSGNRRRRAGGICHKASREKHGGMYAMARLLPPWPCEAASATQKVKMAAINCLDSFFMLMPYRLARALNFQ